MNKAYPSTFFWIAHTTKLPLDKKDNHLTLNKICIRELKGSLMHAWRLSLKAHFLLNNCNNSVNILLTELS
ncbi:hypothetical protein EV146_12242 [Mesobacillus foraminis]|uniref:Uncharacterized protein n=1 Tax=Mesobacillus foraminis TaxID=279826 RepID=A0A4R2AYA4_9BACI|nr:hypothetical protein EV146_12242 [Mesobacillus foraminis]